MHGLGSIHCASRIMSLLAQGYGY
ncbi:DUF3927 domain-containing protein [Sinorhizobium meliloti]|uniref:DUF3927 domain-containing protein n=1 Tax=Rhizobium meliloti TaxID=382 RepID=A0A3M2KJX2_RHIML|nr:DUF3927 domain-containing protein [Sinorhizobium meliloti]MDW9369776.1 DUF3927 domain-containing protein [Sinorhizobium meliloti]MDW9383709.1 DUF3927 domain-containing protein [Sinorhizobium meliloti]MDW9393169.1 DUF3927 domain-containing protein [Sinorhizobium meliloti]MDW9398797.1 DUF3927 domain-containing protein [Sinorhizobium meliloti]